MRSATLLFAVSISAVMTDEGHKELNVYPKASKGMTRFVVELPKESDESTLQVEIIVGKVISMDPVNHARFGGKLLTSVIKGYGYPYYTVEDLGNISSTLIGVKRGTPNVMRFVQAGGMPLIRYNSRLPIVVYVPADA